MGHLETEPTCQLFKSAELAQVALPGPLAQTSSMTITNSHEHVQS